MATAPDPRFGLHLPPQRTGRLSVLGHSPDLPERSQDQAAGCSCGWRDDGGETATRDDAWVMHVASVACGMAHRDPNMQNLLIQARDAALKRADGPADDPAEILRRIEQLRH